MDQNLNEDKPIFQQISEKIEAGILDGSIGEGDRIPSTNEFAKFYHINPATAGKGINQLVEQNIIYKKRGIGMFVSDGARSIILSKRKNNFYHDYVIPLKMEAEKLGFSARELADLIMKEAGK